MTWIKRYATPFLLIILAFAFISRVYNLHLPDAYVFDEVYHGVTAKLIARNDVRAYEWWNPPVEPNTAVDWLHPPIAKYTQAASILIFGENSFSWRLSSAIFGVGVIWLVYLLANQLFHNKTVGLLGALLASFDGLLLVQSRVAMNDIHVTFFILLTLLFFLKYRQKYSRHWLFLTGLSAGLAVSTKWSGIFVLVPIWLFEVANWLKHYLTSKEITIIPALKHFVLVVSCWVALPIAVYLLSYSHMFIQGKDLHHFQELHRQIWWYQTNLTATHSYQSRPLQWFVNARPVWYYVNYGDNQIANIYAFGNPVLFWVGDLSVIFTIILVLASLYDVIRQMLEGSKRLKIYASFFPLAFLAISYLVVWLPWQLSPRIMFFYHYTPAVALLCIILAYWLVNLSLIRKFQPWGKIISVAIVILIGITYGVFYPHWTGIPVNTDFANTVYFSIKSWK